MQNVLHHRGSAGRGTLLAGARGQASLTLASMTVSPEAAWPKACPLPRFPVDNDCPHSRRHVCRCALEQPSWVSATPSPFLHLLGGACGGNAEAGPVSCLVPALGQNPSGAKLHFCWRCARWQLPRGDRSPVMVQGRPGGRLRSDPRRPA